MVFEGCVADSLQTLTAVLPAIPQELMSERQKQEVTVKDILAQKRIHERTRGTESGILNPQIKDEIEEVFQPLSLEKN